MLTLSLESFGYPIGRSAVINKEKITSRPLDTVPGKYQINVQILTRKPVSMIISSSPLMRSILKNGLNNIICDVTKTIPVTISLISADRDYQLTAISATLLFNRQHRILSEKTSSLPTHKTLPRTHQIESVSKTMTSDSTDSGKKTILLVIDTEGWCFHNICKMIIGSMAHLYNILLVSSTKRPNYHSLTPPHMIIKFWYGYDHIDPFDVFPDAIRMVCIYDMHNWNQDFNGSEDIINSPIYVRFLENIKKSHIIGYSCEMIRKLLVDRYSEIVKEKELIDICDGVDESIFTLQPYSPPKPKLVVGWVGNALMPVKRFQELRTRLEREDWIEFTVREKGRPISLVQMPNFYQSIDVLVCSSLSEGTPNPILEASACGRAWVSTRVGIVEALNRKNQCGIIVDDMEQIVPALFQLHTDRNLMVELGRRGCINILQDFTWTKRLVAFQDIFAKHLGSPIIQSKLVCQNFKHTSIDNSSCKIMITSTQYPRYGGAATCAYEMHRYLISNGYDSKCIFFDNSVRGKPELYNPDNLINVYQHKLAGGADKTPTISYESIRKFDQPDKIFAFNYLAPIISKFIFPGAEVYYMVTGCGYINNNNLISVDELLSSPFPLELKIFDEKTAIRVSDKIIPNTPLMANILEHCYLTKISDPIDLHEIFRLESLPDQNRIYDMVFIASDLGRKVKNTELLKNIYHSPRLVSFNKLVIGKNSQSLIGSDFNINLKCLEFMDQNSILNILKQTKIVIVCSLIESYSIVAVEASQMGCIVLASQNAACSSMMNQFFVINDYLLDNWISRIELILSNYSYYQTIYSTRFFETSPMTSLLTSPDMTPLRIIFVSVDIPYIGGCATNTYRMIKVLRDQSKRKLNIFGIFISNQEGEVNPDNLPGIYRVPYGPETRQKLVECRHSIESNSRKEIDYIFLKNYKLYPFIQSVFGDIRVIFSPSGFRSVSSSDHRSVGYLENKSVIDITNIQDPYKFILDNDRYLDDYAIKNADIVMPNSRLSHRFIEDSLPNMPTLRPPLYITNICYEPNNIPQDTFIQREYDLVFCSYDWRRSCKGYPLVVKIINNSAMTGKKILIIGKSQKIRGDILPPNITSLSYLPNDEVLEYLRRSKVLVIPSVYDSNPNILVEAILSGCNVVTNRKVGNHENLDPRGIVENYDDLEQWINSITLSLHERLTYYGPSCQKIVKSLEDLFERNLSTRTAVAVYKIPPELNTVQSCSQLASLSNFDFRAAKNDEIEFAQNIIDHDIYFHLFYESARKNHCGNINYLVYDQSIDNNIYVNLSRINPNYPSTTAIWKIRNIQSFSRFSRASFYFIRGTYYEFFRKLVPKNAFTVFYPATSLKQEMPGKTALAEPKALTDQIFDIVLHHEDPRYRYFYKGRTYHLFNKFASDIFTCHNMFRDIDFCFVATEKQPTKNHDLFFGLIEYLEIQELTTKIFYVGNLEASIARYAPSFSLSNLKYVSLENHQSLLPHEMVKIYNRSKINISFSGRDAFPRVTGESAACGCFNLAFDTLSDGKNFYEEPLGSLISAPTVRMIRKPGSSLSYVNSPILWVEVQKYLERNYDHNLISITYRKKYNLLDLVKILPGF
jgi:glycosyltransferase involved in cell wall biosynthesis